MENKKSAEGRDVYPRGRCVRYHDTDRLDFTRPPFRILILESGDSRERNRAQFLINAREEDQWAVESWSGIFLKFRLVPLPSTRVKSSSVPWTRGGEGFRTILRVENRDLKGAVESGLGNANARRCPHTALLVPPPPDICNRVASRR